jgi:glycerate 2-kinase
MTSPRQQLLQVYQAALAAVNGESCTLRALQNRELHQPMNVIAIGKAASSMMLGAISALDEHFRRGLLITKTGHVDSQLSARSDIHCLESAHPVPGQRSLHAGQSLLTFLDEQAEQGDFIFLISGGASSLVEVLPEGLQLQDLQRINDWLLGSGWDIAAMNRVRKMFSCIKGGRLAQRLAGRKASCLLISDVPENNPQVIGSGFLVADDIDDAQAHVLPEWLNQLPRAAPPPEIDDACFEKVEINIITTLDDAMRAAQAAAIESGYPVHLHTALIQGDAQLVGQQLAHELQKGDPGLHIWGGETTVRLPGKPGRGGRNQQLALAAAEVIAGSENYFFLAAGTDGTDGPTEDAGALVDGQTLQRGKQAGFDVQQTLAAANAGAFLHASGDLIQTGPTGTNVMDLVLALKLPPA